MKEFMAAAVVLLPGACAAVLPGGALRARLCRYVAAGGVTSERMMAGGSCEEGRQHYGVRWMIDEADSEELESWRCREGHKENRHSDGMWPAAR